MEVANSDPVEWCFSCRIGSAVLQGFVDELRTQWHEVKRAPSAFALALVIGAVASWTAVDWAYRKQIDALRERVTTVQEEVKVIEERLKARDEQLTLEKDKSRAPGQDRFDTASIKTFDLNVTRGGQRSTVSLSPRDRLFLLSFFVPIRPGFRYHLLVDGLMLTEIHSYDEKGNFHIVCDRRVIGLGIHVLTITETDPEARKTDRSFEFSFEM